MLIHISVTPSSYDERVAIANLAREIVGHWVENDTEVKFTLNSGEETSTTIRQAIEKAEQFSNCRIFCSSD